MSRSLRHKSLRNRQNRSDFNPADGLLNLADVMLVFACGLMMALIINWNVDVGAQATPIDLEVGKEITDVQTHENSSLEKAEGDAGYQRMGVLYKDAQTGKMYMLTGE